MEQDYLMEKKVEYMIDLKVKKLSSMLEESFSTIKSLQEEVSVLKNKVERLNLGVSAPAAVAQQTLSGKKEVKKEEPNSRTGEFTPGDVSIEKMFYFGKK